jgi:NitT/TauT family transport system ATP-binding protein
MDEPFAALDAITRDQLAIDLSRICQEQRASVLFVTHSISEAVFLSDRVIVMTERPGTVRAVININLSRPRNLHARQIQEFVEYERQILDLFVAAGLLHDEGKSEREEPL